MLKYFSNCTIFVALRRAKRLCVTLGSFEVSSSLEVHVNRVLLHNGVCTQAVSSSVIVLNEVRTSGCLVGGELLHCSTILQQGRIREVHGFVEDQTWMPGVIGSLPAYSIIDFTYKNE